MNRNPVLRPSHAFVRTATFGGILLFARVVLAAGAAVPQFSVHEVALQATGIYTHPYIDLTADAVLAEPGSKAVRVVPLFWDGGSAWKFRFAPDKTGTWTWVVKSADPSLDGKSGSFDCLGSARQGSIRSMRGFPYHFERQDGSPFWFMGDTAWALYTDSKEEMHDRAAAERYIDARAAQGFNVLHSMLQAESGWGNSGGPPWHEIASEKINPAYWQELDWRLAYANAKGIVCGLALAWGDKRQVEPYAWRRFPSVEARKRYARYVAARYSAFEVFFIVSGEWHAEIRTRPDATEDSVRREFFEIGHALRAADSHARMIAIHPMTAQGSVREFNEAAWMSFGDYQQNYRDLHERLLRSRSFGKPVVNAEYGYYLRDQSGDGVPDKDNSTSIEAMRHATWDIVMAGGYAVTGFGTTYFGGNRDPGAFNVATEKNKPWEAQMGHLKTLFRSLEWWKLEPHDELLRCATPRGQDSRELNQVAPPKTTYWCLAEMDRQYLVYLRGLKEPINLAVSNDSLRARQFNPRTGEFTALGSAGSKRRFEYRPPDDQDWVIVLN